MIEANATISNLGVGTQYGDASLRGDHSWLEGVIGGHLAGAGESGGAQPENSDEALLRSLVAFAAAGLRAAAATDASAAPGGGAA